MGNIFFCIAMGVFMLKEDQHMQKFYKCLSTYPFRTCAERGMGGLSCLLPFLACDAMNLVFDLLMKSRFVAFNAYGVSLAGTMLAEGIAAYHAWQVLKVCQEGQDILDLEMDGGGSGNYIQTGDGSARAPVLNQSAGGRNGGTNFAMFSGPGHRLVGDS